MTNRVRAALAILTAALGLGIVGDSLLRVSPWGHNFVAWTGLLVVAGGLIGKFYKLETVRNVLWAAVPVALFCVGLSLRDSPVLRFLNIAGIISVFGIVFMRSVRGQYWVANVSEYVIVWVGWLFMALGRFFLLLGADVPWKEIGKTDQGGKYRSALIGVSIALPLVLVFGGLFVSADAVFKSFTVDLIHVDAERVLTAILLIPLFTWLAGATLRQMLIPEPDSPPVVSDEGFRLGRIELAIIFGSIVTLFLGFIIVQIGYLFGGDQRVQQIAGLTYAEYARSGFFELVTVSGIAIILVLTLQSLHRQDDGPTHRLFLVLSGLFIVEQFVVLASAAQRMLLYIRAYGMSDLRFYVGAAIVWLSVALLWLLISNSTRKPRTFAFGALLALYAAIWACTAMNPDRYVARYNLSRGKDIDIYYLCNLSYDAVPDILAQFDKLPKEKQREAAYYLLEGPGKDDFTDWRTMNYGRYQAAWAIYGKTAKLRKLAKGFEPPYRSDESGML